LTYHDQNQTLAKLNKTKSTSQPKQVVQREKAIVEMIGEAAKQR
jgi:hypothetical protein